MNTEELAVSADLCAAIVAEAFALLNPEQPCVVILRVSAANAFHAEDFLTMLKRTDGIYAHSFVDSSYSNEEWSLECRDKLIHSRMA